MGALTVTAKGQVTLRKDLLKHLGVRPGEQIEVETLPDGRVENSRSASLRQDGGRLRPAEARERSLLVDRGDERNRRAWLGR